jgi:dipeptidyl-peptidase-4
MNESMIRSWKLMCLAVLCSLCLSSLAQAQMLKKVTMEDVFKKGTFNQKTVSGINWMKDGQYYSSLVQRYGASAVVKINLATGQEAEILLDGSKLGVNFSSYSFNTDESKALIASDVESIYRRSTKGIFYVVDMASGEKQQRDPFSEQRSGSLCQRKRPVCGRLGHQQAHSDHKRWRME